MQVGGCINVFNGELGLLCNGRGIRWVGSGSGGESLGFGGFSQGFLRFVLGDFRLESITCWVRGVKKRFSWVGAAEVVSEVMIVSRLDCGMGGVDWGRAGKVRLPYVPDRIRIPVRKYFGGEQ